MPLATSIGSGVAVCATDDRLGTNCNCFGRDASNRVDGVDLPRAASRCARVIALGKGAEREEGRGDLRRFQSLVICQYCLRSLGGTRHPEIPGSDLFSLSSVWR